MRPRKAWAFGAIVSLFLLYGAYQLSRFSFVFHGERYFILADDQMVSMAYAKSLINGDGLVWFKGAERVEGFSNPLWVFVMAALQLLPLPASKASLAVQLLCLALLAANLFLVRRLSTLQMEGGSRWTHVAVALVACYYPLNFWSLSGFEVSLLAPVLSLAVLWQLEELSAGRYRLRALLLLAVATLVRLDMVVPFLALAGHRVLFQREGWRRTVAQGALALLVILCLQTLARSLYYGDLLPNTYALKMTGYPATLRISRGALVFWGFVSRSWGALLLLPLALLAPERRSTTALLLMPLAGLGLYSIYVGGDSWEYYGLCNRFIVVAMPLAIVVLISLARRGFEHLAPRASLFGVTAGGVGTLVGLWLALNWTGEVAGYGWALSAGPPEKQSTVMQFKNVKLAEKVTAPGATIATTWAGVGPFFLERRFVDLLGKNDRHVARRPMARFDQEQPRLFLYNNHQMNECAFFYPGHLKWDYGYSIARLSPDVVLQLWGPPKGSMEYVEADYESLRTSWGTMVFLRTNSPWVNWSAVRQGL